MQFELKNIGKIFLRDTTSEQAGNSISPINDNKIDEIIFLSTYILSRQLIEKAQTLRAHFFLRLFQKRKWLEESTQRFSRTMMA